MNKRTKSKSASSLLTLTSSSASVSVSQPSLPGDQRISTSKRKRSSPVETQSTNSLKRHRSSERQEIFSINSPSQGKSSSTDNFDNKNINLPSIDFNVCALSESANGDSQGALLAEVPMEGGNDIFNFTSNVVLFTPADNVSGMDFASVFLPIHDTNVCVC